MNLVESFSVMPLTKLGWLVQFIEDPKRPRLPKREAADRLVQDFHLPPIDPILKNSAFLAAAKPGEVQLALAESVRTIHFALTRFGEMLRMS
jgi:hypothetical protein